MSRMAICKMAALNLALNNYKSPDWVMSYTYAYVH